ncbi:MAG: HAD-IC family P-type ATPase [Ignavibacteriae bacterium]|nr:HAD family hydrolase [Ignavibacteriota bacterium]NOG97226.1 HAD-IC family P-type ATPase [Ignavibacteriota bacterium]
MPEEISHIVDSKLICYHCGEECPDDTYKLNDNVFCCNGCKTVYEMLKSNDLCDYYAYEETPGLKKSEPVRNYSYLDDPELQEKLIDFTDGTITTITFFIPQMHCSSCIWILENLYKFNPGIIESKADFLKKKVSIKYAPDKILLSKVVELLDSIGYEPSLNLEAEEKEVSSDHTKKLYYKIGIAGFCFGNIMLLSFPEYLSIVDQVTDDIKQIFSFLNLLLALPVFFYSSSEYFSSAYKGLKRKFINIDVPIAIGISILFFRSLIEVILQTGVGYFDSLAGLVFFLLIGRLFQNKTYDTLNFERNYKSYFPIAVTITKNSNEKTIPLDKLRVGQRLVIKNNELIPTDSVLIKGTANIDYSFVTGEAAPVERKNGDLIYAGGKQIGGLIELETVKEVSQSYLTELWNDKVFTDKKESRTTSLANMVSKYFTFIVLAIAAATAVYWLLNDPAITFNAVTAILIIACPCALALSTPFTLGNTMRIFGRNKFYVKNAAAVENLANIDTIIFDKTGTITDADKAEIKYEGEDLSDEQKSIIKSLVKNSSHPLSRKIFNFLEAIPDKSITDFMEIPGKGLQAFIDDKLIKLGSEGFINPDAPINPTGITTQVFVSINGRVTGCFKFFNSYRKSLKQVLANISNKYSLSVLSGDNPSEKERLKKIFPDRTEMKFNQSPHDKLNYISTLQSKNKNTLMIGDGLNDAGALAKSDVGISISENVNNFSPACDSILDSNSFDMLPAFISFAKLSKKIIIASFIISFLYNLVGLFFAVQGLLSPLIAAILMPLSSISVVVFTSFTTTAFAKMKGLL